jgi:hypothetical protein
MSRKSTENRSSGVVNDGRHGWILMSFIRGQVQDSDKGKDGREMMWIQKDVAVLL